ncbi:MAG: isopentenyl-diphosphate Delta-isomerase [Sulfitobacter sp.]
MNDMPHQTDGSALMIPAWINGELRPYDKLQTHVEGLRHLAVSVFVLAGDHVLIQRRALGKYHTPGLWANSCCTHPNWGEDMGDCAQRRLAQELGITNLALEHRGQVEYRADVGGGLIEHEVVDVFVGQAELDLPLALNPSEVMETKWLPLAQLTQDVATRPEIYTPWLRIYLAKHRQMILGN